MSKRKSRNKQQNGLASKISSMKNDIISKINNENVSETYTADNPSFDL